MKKLILLLASFTFAVACNAQQNTYWQQQVDYRIHVSLNDTAKTLDGYIGMQYQNNSPDTLHFIWFHVWPNAFKNDRTAFSDQQLENGSTAFYFSSEEKKGYINQLDFKVDKITAFTEDHPQHQDIIKLILPQPLAPGKHTYIETPFHVKLPYNFSRGGYIKQSFQVTQWYPKPAVYDRKGWHAIPYLDQGEFYSEFGKYAVDINVPEAYAIASTGRLTDEKKEAGRRIASYSQENIHDFAWFADKDFALLKDTLQLSGRTIDVYAFYNKANEADWKNSIASIKRAVITKSNWIGEYPYDVVTVVERPGKGNGGMEYPTITLISNDGDEKLLDEVIYHEVGHNWFYGILASNERLHPWMDEGMNSYYDNRYSKVYYPAPQKSTNFFQKRIPENPETVLLEAVHQVQLGQPVETPSENFSWLGYGLTAYNKAAQWMSLLEAETGTAVFDSIMKQYFQLWKFKHPYPEDFKAIAESVSGKKLDALFARLHEKGSLVPKQKKSLKLTTLFSLRETEKYHYIFLAPAVGYNHYDQLMLGALLHNYTLPTNRFQWMLAPLYSTGAGELNGTGRLSYTMFPGKKGQQLEFSVAGGKFSMDQFTDSANSKHYLQFSKLVPSVKYVFAQKNPRSTLYRVIQWKTFLIAEKGLLFSRDTINQTDVISFPVSRRYVHQLQFTIQNNRKLYPWQLLALAEKGKGFLRVSATAQYFFNYPSGGGLDLRFFAGKFIYTGEKTFLSQFETDRYHLNMTGPKGYEDYTYSNYFIGRNEFDGLLSQQIMARDGGFKVRTDLLSDKIGKTDDWLTALNLSTTIPNQFNPLSVLPIKIPLRIFADIGTYAEAWKKDAATGRFLYDAGLQLSFFNNVVNIYFPVLYSKVYDDYFKSTITEKRFRKNIAFSIDIQRISLRKLFPQSPF